jgi:1-acyl-sn-glycerol-3-phosphate acyltransferase
MKIYPSIYYNILKLLLGLYIRFFLKLRYREKTELPDGPKIFFINHPTVWEAFPLMICQKEKLHVLVEDPIWSFPVPRFLFTTTNQVRLHTGEMHKETLADTHQLIGMGENILVSPEGGRTPSGTEVRARIAPIRMVLDAQVPLIPVGVHIHPDNIKVKNVHYNIDGKKWTDKALFPRFRASYGVLVGEPIYLISYFDKELTKEEYQSIADGILKKIYLLADEAEGLFD